MSELQSLLILGATSGIARAIARRYAAAGYRLYLAGRDLAELERDAADLHVRSGAAVSCHVFDILDHGSHGPLLDGLETLPGAVVSAVGLMAEQAACDADPQLADLVLRSNLNGPAHLLSMIARRMAARGSGAIIGISSVAGDRGRASNYGYGAAKAGFTAFLSGLRGRLLPSGVHVMTVKPGFVRTRMTAGMDLPPLLTAAPQEVAEAIYRGHGARRDVVYVKPIWRWIMLCIRLIPERLFKRMSI